MLVIKVCILKTKKGVGGMSGTNKSEKIRDSTRRLTTTSQQQENISSCCPWERRGPRRLKKGPSGATGSSKAPKWRPANPARDCATASGTAWEAAAGTSHWAGWTPPTGLQPPRAGHPTAKSSRTRVRRRSVGRRTVSVIVYAERFKANVRLTIAAGRQLWHFRGNGPPSHQQPASPGSRSRGTVGWWMSHVVGPLLQSQ